MTNEKGRTCLYAATTPGKRHDYLFVSHVDVVPAMDRSQYKPRQDGDWLYGRGACDTKGNVAVIAQVLVNLVGKASVGAFLATDEEGSAPEKGQPTPQLAIDAGYVPRKFILVGDSAGEAPDQLFYAEKGHARICLTARGKGGHSSTPWLLDNPVPKLVAGYSRALEAMPPPATADDQWRDCLSPTMLKGSDVGNQIPDRAEMTFSLRFVEPDGLERHRQTIADVTGLKTELIRGTPPGIGPSDSPELLRFREALKRAYPERSCRLVRSDAANDSRYFTQFGKALPTTGMNCTGGHTACEWCEVADIGRFTRFLVEFLDARVR